MNAWFHLPRLSARAVRISKRTDFRALTNTWNTTFNLPQTQVILHATSPSHFERWTCLSFLRLSPHLESSRPLVPSPSLSIASESKHRPPFSLFLDFTLFFSTSPLKRTPHGPFGPSSYSSTVTTRKHTRLLSLSLNTHAHNCHPFLAESPFLFLVWTTITLYFHSSLSVAETRSALQEQVLARVSRRCPSSVRSHAGSAR